MIFLQSPLKAQQYLQLALLVHDQTMESSHISPIGRYNDVLKEN